MAKPGLSRRLLQSFRRSRTIGFNVKADILNRCKRAPVNYRKRLFYPQSSTRRTKEAYFMRRWRAQSAKH
ncbi:hypothetical protein PO124_04190 [Bacillus licheniformis]|nr:hypothetical protein [Bacillus licheniformis]